MQDLVTDLLQTSSFGVWDLVLAAAIVVAGWFGSTWARRGTKQLLERWSGIAPGSVNLVSRLVKYAILLFTVGVVLTVLGAPLQPLLAAVLIVATVAFLALRGIAANFGAGLVIQARHPVRIGDHIEVEGTSGRIVELTGRAVLLRTSDGRTVRVPNTMLLESPLRNATENGAVRSEIRARISAHPDLDRVCPTLLDTVDSVTGLHGARPEILLRTTTPAWVDISIRFWSRYEDREAARSDVVRAVSDALAGAGLVASVSSDPPRFLTAVLDEID